MHAHAGLALSRQPANGEARYRGALDAVGCTFDDDGELAAVVLMPRCSR